MSKISPDNFSDKGSIVKRDTLEIIFDNCSSGGKVLEYLNRIADYVENNDIYKEVKFVIPLQIGTEARRRLFKDFLEDALSIPSKKNKSLHEFYKNNEGRIEVVETNISNAYKFFYAKESFKVLNKDEGKKDKVINNAVELSKGLYSQEEIEEAYEKFERLTEETYKKYKENYKSTTRQIKNSLSSILGDNASSSDLKEFLKEIKKKVFARAGKLLVAEAGDASRYILQSMYSENSLHKEVNEKGKLKSYRKDKGERAIEDYLKNFRDKKDGKIATIVVSEDSKAIRRISKMRKESHNIIIALREEGLGMLLKGLNESTAFFDIKIKEFKSSFKDKDDFKSESTFAKRGVEIITRGTYKGQESAIEK